ncbi:hypothetical protein [Photorhabdus laumondii]|uniref:hypothetical protein n=1 Tax=Photorhabdus laumondii TaxID=2218628 RepID=UPI0022A97D23|nr:hypothetical protein [Photorhabdus laumondii]
MKGFNDAATALHKKFGFEIEGIAKHYTLWISRCIATARERIPGSIDNDVTGVSERSQQRGNLKDDRYIHFQPETNG